MNKVRNEKNYVNVKLNYRNIVVAYIATILYNITYKE